MKRFEDTYLGNDINKHIKIGLLIIENMYTRSMVKNFKRNFHLQTKELRAVKDKRLHSL